MTDRDPLPDELADLFAAERAAPAGDPESRAKVRSRLAAAVGLLPGKAAAAAGTGTILGGAGKIIAVLAISVGGGITAVTVAKSSEPSYAAPPAIQLVAAERVEPSPAPLRVVQRDDDQLPAPEPDVEPVVDEKAAGTVRVAPPSEAKLLKRAWSALASGDATQTLELIREVERLHPGGALVEEREALRIQALVKLGLLVEARTAAQQFVVQFPRSVHRPHVERAIKPEESP